MPRPPMSTVAGYKDGSPLTTAELDTAFGLTALQSDMTTVQSTVASLSSGSATFSVATGTSDALVASVPSITSLVDGTQINVRAIAANTTTTPTITLNALGTFTITKLGSLPLDIGDIQPDLEITLRYDVVGTKFQLMNGVDNYVQAGAGAVTRTVRQRLRDYVSIIDFGGKGDYAGGGVGTGTDNFAAIGKIFTQFGANAVVHFPYIAGAQYRFSNSGSFANMGALTIDADDGVVFYFDAFPGYIAGFAGIRCVRPIKCVSLDLTYNFVLGDRGQKQAVDKDIYLSDATFDRSTVSSVLTNTTEVLPLKVFWNTGDAFSTDSLYTTPNAKSIAFGSSPTDGNFHMGLRYIAVGDELTVDFEGATGVPTMIAMVRASGGYSGVFFGTDAAGTSLQTFRKNQAVASSGGLLSYLGQVTHQSYAAYFSHITIRPTGYNAVTAISSFDVLFSGSIVYQGTVNGVIYQAGFGLYGDPAHAGAGVTINNWTVVRNKEPGGAKIAYPLIIGDSRAATRADCWPQYLRESLEGTAGMRVVGMYNYAVAGDSSTQQLARLTAGGVPGAAGGPAAPILPTVCIIDVFTNDIQGSFSISTTLANYTSMIAIVAAAAPNCKFVLANTFLWYDQAQNGGIGQNSGNYGGGAAYRTAIMRYCSDNGYQLLDWNEILGPITSNFDNGFPAVVPQLNSNLPAVQDNIHPASFAARLMGWAAARCVAGLMVQKPTIAVPWTTIPTTAYLNSWTQNATQPLKYRIDKDGFVHFNGVVNIGTTTDGTIVMQLPPHLAPDQSTIRQLLPFDAGGMARFELTAADCDLRIDNKTAAGVSFFFMDGFAPYKVANGLP